MFRYLDGYDSLDLIPAHEAEYDSILIQKILPPRIVNTTKLLTALPAETKYFHGVVTDSTSIAKPTEFRYIHKLRFFRDLVVNSKCIGTRIHFAHKLKNMF